MAKPEVGEIVQVEIESIGEKGDGIAKLDNFVIIVKGAEKGETYKVKIKNVKTKYAFADIVA